MNDKMKKVIARRNGKSYANMVANPPRKKKIPLSKIFQKMPKNSHQKMPKNSHQKMPKNSHMMPDGKTVMSRVRHTKTSKVLGKLKKKKKKVAKY